ncbi:hypothetical protein U9M48_005211 [Paspalum notatum var. saurae]|uniref:F-box domain-containing protein n=1 Tax=Paspalum notatum var. saurae TaxID=547442 RepID=A0AAQ3SFC0_PASNO
MDCPNSKRRAAAAAAAAGPGFPEDAILEILARVPARSIHRFMCVSRRWRDLIADPLHRRRFPQTLEGFFFSDAEGSFFAGMPGIPAPLFDRRFSFLTKLPGNDSGIRLLHSCNGLLLFGHGAGYVVCNPATEQWVAVPGPGAGGCPSSAAPTYIVVSDGPAASLCFHLIHLWQKGPYVVEVLTRWMESMGIVHNAFVDGMLHFTVFHHDMGKYLIVGLDWEGTTCRVMSWPDKHGLTGLFLGRSQGRLYCMTACQEDKFFNQTGISIWVLQNPGAEAECVPGAEAEWVLKHNVNFLKLFGQRECRVHVDYDVVSIHPDFNLVFFVQHGSRKLIAYDMDNEKVYDLRTIRQTYGLCTPYVPCYSELSVLANKY